MCNLTSPIYKPIKLGNQNFRYYVYFDEDLGQSITRLINQDGTVDIDVPCSIENPSISRDELTQIIRTALDKINRIKEIEQGDFVDNNNLKDLHSR